ncbi:hypothetical protein WMY93_003381 [Mugilogobius chulae]|uniref:Uncharacterized protein n=1 Tax=Mugilogobius chulae TaxID=88201 RepID=A0AAW0Q4R4_9GOBI
MRVDEQHEQTIELSHFHDVNTELLASLARCANTNTGPWSDRAPSPCDPLHSPCDPLHSPCDPLHSPCDPLHSPCDPLQTQSSDPLRAAQSGADMAIAHSGTEYVFSDFLLKEQNPARYKEHPHRAGVDKLVTCVAVGLPLLLISLAFAQEVSVGAQISCFAPPTSPGDKPPTWTPSAGPLCTHTLCLCGYTRKRKSIWWIRQLRLVEDGRFDGMTGRESNRLDMPKAYAERNRRGWPTGPLNGGTGVGWVYE